MIAGQVALDERAYREEGIVDAFACKSGEMRVEYAIENAGRLLEDAVRAFTMKYL